jgi:hypothetical protein
MNSLLVSLLALTAGAGGSWSDSFDSKTVATYLDSQGVSALVAAAGDPASSAKPAAKALITALRATGKTSVVADDGALGNLSGLSDDDIVAKARRGSASLVAIVRVFPGADAQPPTAVVTFYSVSSGKNLSAFTVAQGAPVASRVAGSAVPSAAMESVSAVAQQSAPASNQSRDKELEQRGIWSQDQTMITVNQYGATTGVSRWTVFFRGKYGPQLSGGELYDYLGKPDLAASYRSRSTTRWSLIGGGLAGLVVGSGLATASVVIPGPCNTKNSFTLACTGYQEPNVPALIGGGVLATAGFVVTMAGLFVDPNPVSIEETNRMVDQFNEQILQGQPSSRRDEAAHDTVAAAASSAPPVQLGVFATPHGGGLSLAFSL